MHTERQILSVVYIEKLRMYTAFWQNFKNSVVW